MRRLAVAIATAALLAGTGPAARAAEPAFADIVTGDQAYGLFGRAVWASVWIAAAPKAVFATLTDYEHFHEFMPLVERVDVLVREPRRAVIKLRMRYLSWFSIEQVDERILKPHSRIDYRGIQGPIRSLDGAWALGPERGGTRLRYHANVDPGMPIPGQVTAALVKHGLPGLLDGVRRRTESGGRWKKGEFP